MVIAELSSPAQIRIGRKVRFTLEQGFYGYVGSAMGGIEGRIARHLSQGKKFHWHIDHLLKYAAIRGVIYAETDHKEECHVAQVLQGSLKSVSGFGCSDCRCPSHLFFSENLTEIKALATDAFRRCKCRPFCIEMDVCDRSAA